MYYDPPYALGNKPSKKRFYTKRKPKQLKVGKGDLKAEKDCSAALLALKCDFCLLSQSNLRGEPEQLLVCCDCQATAHPSCMDYGPELAERSRLAPWQCINCKACSVCGDPGNADMMLFCDYCDKGYHMACHQPTVTQKPYGKWSCLTCIQELNNVPIPEEEEEEMMEEEDIDVEEQELYMPLASRKEESQTGASLMRGREETAGSLDASQWTIQDVEDFINRLGFSEQSWAFREQEIDGRSLLLMKRSDVLSGLSIPLGPALKIYKHVEDLQLTSVNQQKNSIL